MDGSKKVMESFDSLWFFNNVLTLPTFQHKDHAAALDGEPVEEEKPSNHKIQVVPRCPKCGEIAVGIEQQILQPVEEVEFAKPTEKPERRRRRKSRKRSKKIVLGELHLGFHGNLASEYWFSEETYGYPNSETQGYKKMPPLNDGLAMKEHLKSWAYAVACTVR